MKKTHIGILATALIMMFASCGTNNDSKTPQASEQAEQTVKNDPPKPKDTNLAAMDSIYTATETALNNFISEHGDHTGLNDVWWDSKKAEDQQFKRIRICPIPGSDVSDLIIERRPFPFTNKLEVLGYSISKTKTGDSYKYVVEASRFVKNKQVESHKEDIVTRDEMLKAVAKFQTRLQEANENVAAIEVNCHQKEASIKKLSKNG